MPLTWRITEVSNPGESPRPSAFEAAAAARQLHDPCALALAESGRHDLHALAGARSLAARPDPRSVHSPWVRREGVEPSRLAARASETRVAACYTTSARSGWRGLNPQPSPWRGDALPAELHPPVSGRSGATARSRTGDLLPTMQTLVPAELRRRAVQRASCRTRTGNLPGTGELR